MNQSPDNMPRYRFVRRRWHRLMAVIDAVGAICARARRGLFGKREPGDIQPAAVNRLLVIQLDHLGDAVISTTLFLALRRHFPKAAIDVLAAPWNFDVFAGRREVARTFVSRWNRFRRGFRWAWPLALVYWAWTLRRRRYDLAIDVRGDFVNALLMAFSGVPHRVGWACAGGGFLLSRSVEFVPNRPEVESRRAILSALGVGDAQLAEPQHAPSPEAKRFVFHLLGEFSRRDRPLLVFHVGAGTASKKWPVEHWRELVGRAVVEQNARVILVGSSAESRAAEEITEGAPWPGVMDWTGRLSVDQLAALAERCDVFVGGDSGPAHLAAAVGARVVAIFSATNVARQWQPRGPRVTVLRHDVPCGPCYLAACKFADHPCMRQLLPEQVAAAIHRLLDPDSAVPAPKFKFGDANAHRPGRLA